MELANSINPKTITITLPATIYSHVERQSQLMRRSIAEELVAVVTEYWQKEAFSSFVPTLQRGNACMDAPASSSKISSRWTKTPT